MANEDKKKDELLDEAISLYTQGHLQDAVLKLESLVNRFPDDIELRDTLSTVKAEVHDQNREKAAAKPAVSITTADDIKQNARKRARLAIVILIFLVILITGLWGLARVLSSYQNRGTGTYRLAEEKAGDGKESTDEGATPSPTETPAQGADSESPGTPPAPGTTPGAVNPIIPTVIPPLTLPEAPSTTPATTPVTTPVNPTPSEEPETPQPAGEGYFKVSPSPPTTVYVDNVMVGNSQRLGAIKLTEGDHSVTMVSQQYGNRSFTVSIKAGKTTISSFPY